MKNIVEDLMKDLFMAIITATTGVLTLTIISLLDDVINLLVG